MSTLCDLKNEMFSFPHLKSRIMRLRFGTLQSVSGHNETQSVVEDAEYEFFDPIRAERVSFSDEA